MTAATMLKRINTMRKELGKYEKEIRNYSKLAEEAPCETARVAYQKWIGYYRKMIDAKENQIAEASKKAAAMANNEEREAMIKDMAEDMAKRGFADRGFTTNGLRYAIEHNMYGFTDRTEHCYSMTIEGKGMVFTSGTLETVARYILNN